jgi:hypothetical protein
LLDHFCHVRSPVKQVPPDGRAGKATDDGHAKPGSRAGGILHILTGAAADAILPAVTPDVSGQSKFILFIDHIAYRLADIMIADRVTFQAVFFQDVTALREIGIVAQCAFHVEVISPAGKLEPVITEPGHLLAEGFEWQIPPLAAGDGYWTRHDWFPCIGFV